MEVSNAEEVLREYKDEFKTLQGTAAIVDRLENLASRYPGIEIDMNLYRELYPFTLDDFQKEGLQHMIGGKNVLVTTPTGSGKTVVGELAIYFSLMMGLRVAYTTPLKALSNQKFADFKARYGADRVGLLTGDVVINRGAPITIMTTEVFRNMIYDDDSDNQLGNLFTVIFDEFHYMNDPDRGTVWEESVISCPPHIRILALSATMGNVEDIQGWMSSIHGPTELVSSTYRPVPLRYQFATKHGLNTLFKDVNAGPGAPNGIEKNARNKLEGGSVLNPLIIKLEEAAYKKTQQRSTSKGRPFKAKANPQQLVARYEDVARDLHKADLLPAIVFIFSRAGCEQNAKLVMNAKNLKLLSDDEVTYVKRAIHIFARENPEIPVSRSLAQMLQAGVAVHHAGLIPVWKEFIEKLFNANMIKILFATETLAAGVNMPARTTVISSVTKRINSEIVKLKTSQLLQMAGRAGRRGKDTQGTVVIMRNRFEDSKMGHKILTTEVDDIRSHFKTSYSLVVRLLQIKTMEECRALVERGFGSYQMARRIEKKKSKEVDPDIDMYRRVLQKYTLLGARQFLKLSRRLEKERRNKDFLLQRMVETDAELVNAIADYMPLGTGLHLRNGEDGYFLGDVQIGSGDRNRGYGVLTTTRNVYIVRKEHIQSFAEADASITPKTAEGLLGLVDVATEWKEMPLGNSNAGVDAVEQKGGFTAACSETHAGIEKDIDTGLDMDIDMNAFDLVPKTPILQGMIPIDAAKKSPALAMALRTLEEAPLFPQVQKELPGSVVKQARIAADLEAEMALLPIVQEDEGELVLDALRYAAAQRDPVAFVEGGEGGDGGGHREAFAWRMFQSVLSILQQCGAMDGATPTALGELIGSLTADNELWLAMVLKHPKVAQLEPGAFAAIMCAVITDGYKASNAYIKYKPSEPAIEALGELEELSWDLKVQQQTSMVDFPVFLAGDAGGLVESWVGGVTWRELCRDTSLDQGDLCRMLRRTLEVLKQVPLAHGVDQKVADLAIAAASRMNRFPVAEDDPDMLTPSNAADRAAGGGSGVGFGPGVSFGVATGEGAAAATDEPIDLSFLEEDDDDVSALDGVLDSIAVLDEIFSEADAAAAGREKNK